MADLEDLCLHINTKISTIKRILQLRNIGKRGQEQSVKSIIYKVKCEVILVNCVLDKMEKEIQERLKLMNILKELQKNAERSRKEAEHLSRNIPLHLPKKTQRCITGVTLKGEEQAKAVEPQCVKKPVKASVFIKEVALITAEEFEAVPTYMKGRFTCEQVNAVVRAVNQAVVSKYKILNQPLKSLKAAARNLYQKFLEEETKDTKGEFFVVEDDIREFTELKVDKCFLRIICILRHCQRVREVRGSKLIRYVIC